MDPARQLGTTEKRKMCRAWHARHVFAVGTQLYYNYTRRRRRTGRREVREQRGVECLLEGGVELLLDELLRDLGALEGLNLSGQLEVVLCVPIDSWR
jgi:hypothetical protein